MREFELNILGCGSALSMAKHFSSAQIIRFQDDLYMIDCGEGSQFQFFAMKLNLQKLDHVFISHLHGDHCLGLPGLVSTFGMIGRTKNLHIYTQVGAEFLFLPFIRFFCNKLPFKLIFHTFNPSKSEIVFENKLLKVSTIPLKHRIPTVGFLIEEKLSNVYHIKKTDCFNYVSFDKDENVKGGTGGASCVDKGISDTKLDNDFFNKKKCRKYAYCSDTAYYDEIIPFIDGVDLLYHDSTFSHKDLSSAERTCHSSAKQAAYIAKYAHVNKLLLGHFSARYSDENILLNEAKKIFMNVLLANDQMVLTI